MPIITPRQKTVIQRRDDAGGVTVLATLEGVSLALDVQMPLVIDGQRYYVTNQRRVEVNTAAARVVTTLTVMEG